MQLQRFKSYQCSVILACFYFVELTIRAQTLYYDTTLGGVGEVAPNGTVSSLAAGFNEPEGIAVNSAGDVFVANEGNNTISEITPTGNVSVFASADLNSPFGLTFDSQGNLYVSNYNYQGNYADTIVKFTPQGVASIYATTSIGNLSGLAFDSLGNLFVEASSSAEILEVEPNGSSSVYEHTFSSSEGLYVIPYGLAVGANNTLYAGCYSYMGSVVESYPSYAEIATGLTGLVGVATDSSGNLYATDANNGKIYEYSTGGSKTTVATGISGANFLAFQPAAAPEPNASVLILFAGLLVFLTRAISGKAKSALK